ncbi:uncharacterized protein LOC143013404 [Genypterus blacodes]|uniref:uncharacterized protein LOC143013404 n=1 Tax=Genypterus blacodes TaxID=154954 RepID=UPI003F7621E0
MRIGAALAFVVFALCPLRLDGITCQLRYQTDYVKGHCPLKLSEDNRCLTVRAWMRAEDFSNKVKIEIVTSHRITIRPRMKKFKEMMKERKIKSRFNGYEPDCIKCPTSANGSALWELVSDCISSETGSVVSASYITTSNTCRESFRVPVPVPKFNVSADQRSKSVSVHVEPGEKVNARLCYRQNRYTCLAGANSSLITIDPSQSPSALIQMEYLLPCVCVEVYYTFPDADRFMKCPFEEETLIDVRDVWLSINAFVYESSIVWHFKCPPHDLKLSASLCWRHHEHLCTRVLNSTLSDMEDSYRLKYNTSAVDKHPQMCVQFSLQGVHHVSCPFQSDMSSWKVDVGPGRQSIFLYLTSSSPAEFSAQFCVLNESVCTPKGRVHSVRMEGNSAEMQVNLPLPFVAEKLCMQVWQSDPALQGKRILCPDYTHRRFGVFAVAALVCVIIVALLGIFIHRLTKNRGAGWLCIQKPVLLVCSSDQSAHVSAVCALASILQGELCAAVRMALWAQSSQKQAGGRSVADLGPIPWLYGQWEAVRKAEGKVLIIWSPEAKTSYAKQRQEWLSMNKNERKKENHEDTIVGQKKLGVELEQDWKVNGSGLGKGRKAKSAGKRDCAKLNDDKESSLENEPSLVIGPVFTAALACLEGALQDCKGHGVALVYFQGLGHSRDIPKCLRGVPRYCLPQDFRGLIQELDGTINETSSGKYRWHCWPRLLSKVVSLWLSRQLAHRLQKLLPQIQQNETSGPRLTSSARTVSARRQNRLKLPLSKGRSVGEQEPLRGSPWRGASHITAI